MAGPSLACLCAPQSASALDFILRIAQPTSILSKLCVTNDAGKQQTACESDASTHHTPKALRAKIQSTRLFFLRELCERSRPHAAFTARGVRLSSEMLTPSCYSNPSALKVASTCLK